MRVAIISDIHGNAHALEAVLADIGDAAPDLTVNLGDHFSGPFQAGQVADRLLAKDIPSIAGNHDRFLIDPPGGAPGRSEVLALRHLTPEHLDWVRALPETLVAGDGDIFMCHGTPQSDSDGWLDDFDENGKKRSHSLAEIVLLAEGIEQSLMLCGHTHRAQIVTLPDGRTIVNPGSVGFQGLRISGPPRLVWSSGAPHARYALADKTKYGWSVQLRALAYDFEAAAKVAEAAGADEQAEALRTGWVSPLPE